MKNWSLCIWLFTIVLGAVCGKEITSSALKQQGVRYPEETEKKKSISLRDSLLAARETEYVTQEEFDETVAALVAMNDIVMTELMHIDTSFTELEETVTETTSRVGSLENLYNTATVRQCLHGEVHDVCPDCNTPSSSTRMGVKGVTFSPPFHKTPKVTFSIIKDDDSGNTRLTRLVWVDEFSQNGMNIYLKVFSNSEAYQVGIRWMACA